MDHCFLPRLPNLPATSWGLAAVALALAWYVSALVTADKGGRTEDLFPKMDALANELANDRSQAWAAQLTDWGEQATVSELNILKDFKLSSQPGLSLPEKSVITNAVLKMARSNGVPPSHLMVEISDDRTEMRLRVREPRRYPWWLSL